MLQYHRPIIKLNIEALQEYSNQERISRRDAIKSKIADLEKQKIELI